MWYRVFGTNEVGIPPEAVLSHLQGIGFGVTSSFQGDDAGWFRAEITFCDTTPVCVEHFLASEEGIRAELNAWAAYLETYDDSPDFAPLMEHMVRTKQLFTIRRPADATGGTAVDKLCLELARFFAQTTDGVYQVDQEGFFSPDGVLLLQER